MQNVKIDKEYFVAQLYGIIYKLEPDQNEVKQDLMLLIDLIRNAPESGSSFPRINGRRMG